MAEKNQDRPKVDIENLEVTELDDQDLEEAAGGTSPVNVNCPCSPSPNPGFGNPVT